MKPNPERDPRYQTLLHLLRTAEALWNGSRTFFARWELGPSQFNVLNLLHQHPAGFTQIELSRQLLMHRSNITGLVDRLQKRGLVQRRDNSHDRRAYTLVLTPAGRRLVESILPHYFRAAEAIFSPLSPRRAGHLLHDLALISANAGRFGQNEPAASPARKTP